MIDERCLDEICDLQAALLMLLDSNLEPSVEAEASRRLLTRARAHEMPEIAIRAFR